MVIFTGQRVGMSPQLEVVVRNVVGYFDTSLIDSNAYDGGRWSLLFCGGRELFEL